VGFLKRREEIEQFLSATFFTGKDPDDRGLARS